MESHRAERQIHNHQEECDKNNPQTAGDAGWLESFLHLDAAGFLGNVEHVQKESQGNEHQRNQINQRAHGRLCEVKGKKVGSKSMVSRGNYKSITRTLCLEGVVSMSPRHADFWSVLHRKRLQVNFCAVLRTNLSCSTATQIFELCRSVPAHCNRERGHLSPIAEGSSVVPRGWTRCHTRIPTTAPLAKENQKFLSRHPGVIVELCSKSSIVSFDAAN